MHDITIRSVQEDDLDAVAELLSQLASVARTETDVTPEHARRIHRAMRSHAELYRNLVAVDGQRVVGFLSMVYYLSFFHDGGTALVNELVVSHERRGRKIGSRLMREAMTMAEADGMDEIEVGTERANEGARAFYRKAGFDQEFVLFGKEFS